MDIVCIGELLVDFLPAGMSENSYPLFEFHPGGAPANVAAAIAKLGGSSAFIGKTGNDWPDQFLIQALAKCSVDVTGMIMDPHEKTSMSLVRLDDQGERSFCFFGDHPADLALKPTEIKKELLSNCRVLHFGARSLLSNSGKESIASAILLAKANGAVISFDPNIRPALWPNKDIARDDCLWGIEHADLVKLSTEEQQLIFGSESTAHVIKRLKEQEKQCVVTKGEEGAYVLNKSRIEHISGFRVSAIDSTGAGDAFWGAFLFATTYLSQIPIIEKVRMACAAGALTTLKKGAIVAQPNLLDIQRLLNSHIS